MSSGLGSKHAARQNVHDVGALKIDEVDDGAVVERHVVVEEFAEGREFLLVGQVAREQEVGYLLKAEPLLFEQGRNEVVEFVATVEEFAFRGLQFAVGVALVAHHIADVGEAHEHTGAVVVAQAALHAKLGELFGINLAGALHRVA